jgi:serine/threonine protein kinase
MVRKVGSSRIVREIGRGGMGIVYEAYQEALDRPVAVKALDAKLARSKEVAERFRREGRAYARLRHEAIVAVHDLVEKDDGLYLVTELVDGTDLARLIARGGALPPECVALVGARVAEALDYVHFNRLRHRDVKPANVMVSREGEVKLMDFGIGGDARGHARPRRRHDRRGHRARRRAPPARAARPRRAARGAGRAGGVLRAAVAAGPAARHPSTAKRGASAQSPSRS